MGRSCWRRGALSFFKGGSKLDRRLGGFFSKQLSVNLSFRLPYHCGVFQAEGEEFALSKVYLAAIVGLLTVHCPIGMHVETSRHFLPHYLAFARLRMKHLGCHTFDEPGDITETELADLTNL